MGEPKRPHGGVEMSGLGTHGQMSRPGFHYETQYYPVSPAKLVALSLLTFGLYEIYWFYRNWKYVQERDLSNISPFWRSVFGMIWYPALCTDLRRTLPDSAVPSSGVLNCMALLYMGLSVSWRAPDPYWLVAFLTFIPLLPAAKAIAAVNRSTSPDFRENSRWRFRHLVLALVSTPLIAFAITSSLAIVPSTQVIPGHRIHTGDRSFLEQSGVVKPGEQILWFYSQGLLSIETDGNLLTPTRAVSYWLDADAGFQIESAYYHEIADLAVKRAPSSLDATRVTVHRRDGSGFILVLSPEDDRDQLFIKELEGLVGR